MADEETKIINDPRSVEEKVLAELKGFNSRLDAIEKRYAETAASVDRLVGEFKDLAATFKAYLANFEGMIEVVNGELLKVKVDQRAIEKRVRSIEVGDRPQVVPQDKEF